MMLTKRQIEKYADVLLWALRTARKKRFKKNDIILIRFELSAIKLAEVLQSKVLDMGMNPVLRSGMTPVMEHDFFEKANSMQLKFVVPGERELFKHVNGSIYLHAPDSLTHLSDIDSRKIGKAAVARKFLRDILRRREDIGEYSWTLCTLPTAELAKQANLTLRQGTNQIIKACFLNMDAPVETWKSVYKEIAIIKRKLNSLSIKYLHVEAKNIDLKIKPGVKRKWIGLSGHNIPSFEIFLSPDWRGTDGTYYADQPSFRSGNYVQGVRLTFKKGFVTGVEAEKGKEFVQKQLAMDKGASRIGEFSLTDKRFSKINKFMANTLYDENFGGRYGNCHVAVGSAYTDTYDGNPANLTKAMRDRLGFNDSALHWDLVNTERKKVTAFLASGEKKIIYENGVFTI